MLEHDPTYHNTVQKHVEIYLQPLILYLKWISCSKNISNISRQVYINSFLSKCVHYYSKTSHHYVIMSLFTRTRDQEQEMFRNWGHVDSFRSTVFQSWQPLMNDVLNIQSRPSILSAGAQIRQWSHCYPVVFSHWTDPCTSHQSHPRHGICHRGLFYITFCSRFVEAQCAPASFWLTAHPAMNTTVWVGWHV